MPRINKMNVFEDLIVELKEENLLENTVIDVDNLSHTDDSHLHETEIQNLAIDLDFDPPTSFEISSPDSENEISCGSYSQVIKQVEEKIDHVEDTRAPDASECISAKKDSNEKEFFRKRAVSEIASLQVVEHILTGVERERMKILPNSFDDLNAKKALHALVQLPDDADAQKRTETEGALVRETESWCSALAARDKNISVANIRLFCENSKPKLSSQALLALGRFYRNLPYSEAVRGKFDFVLTRLFSRGLNGDRRQLIFTHDEMLKHIKMLYADWSSVPLYTADDNDSNLLLTALSFQELATEAEAAQCFDELIKSDFFGRLRLFKESISELFFAPVVTAAAIECNIRFGNAYIDLIEKERRTAEAAKFKDKFDEFNDNAVSDLAARTLDLSALIDVHPVIDFEAVEAIVEEHEYQVERPVRETSRLPVTDIEIKPLSVGDKILNNIKQANKGLVISLFVFLLLSIGIMIWAEVFAPERVSSNGVRTIEFENSNVKDQIKTAKVSGNMLYVVMEAGWESQSKEKRQEFAQKLLQLGGDKGYENVTVFDSKGKMAGYASQTRLDIP